MSSERVLFDPGLQPERTRLAWRRTMLALAVGSLVALRLLGPTLGIWAVWLSLAALSLSCGLWALAAHRSRRIYRALLAPPQPLPGGGLLVLLALVVTAGGVAALAATAHSLL